jgi:hypothetical protein
VAFGFDPRWLACSHDPVRRFGAGGIVVSFAALSADVCGDVANQDIAAFPVSHYIDLLGGHPPAAEVTVKCLFVHLCQRRGLACAMLMVGRDDGALDGL